MPERDEHPLTASATGTSAVERRKGAAGDRVHVRGLPSGLRVIAMFAHMAQSRSWRSR